MYLLGMLVLGYRWGFKHCLVLLVKSDSGFAWITEYFLSTLPLIIPSWRGSPTASISPLFLLDSNLTSVNSRRASLLSYIAESLLSCIHLHFETWPLMLVWKCPQLTTGAQQSWIACMTKPEAHLLLGSSNKIVGRTILKKMFVLCAVVRQWNVWAKDQTPNFLDHLGLGLIRTMSFLADQWTNELQ